MKETICTIPVNDVFGPREGCPVCRMHDMLEQKYVEYITGAAMMAYELTGPLAFVPVWFYNGQRGRCPAWLSRVFYLFYPVHILILGCVTNLLLG